MKRFSVMVQEYGSDHEVEVCQIDGNPDPIVLGYQQKDVDGADFRQAPSHQDAKIYIRARHRSSGTGMNITHRIAPLGVHETVIELRWYAVAGSFLVEAVGLGGSPEEAEANARLLLGQARSKLNEVTAKEVA